MIHRLWIIVYNLGYLEYKLYTCKLCHQFCSLKWNLFYYNKYIPIFDLNIGNQTIVRACNQQVTGKNLKNSLWIIIYDIPSNLNIHICEENSPPETAKDIHECLLTNIKTFFECRLVNIFYGSLEPQIMNILIFYRFHWSHFRLDTKWVA